MTRVHLIIVCRDSFNAPTSIALQLDSFATVHLIADPVLSLKLLIPIRNLNAKLRVAVLQRVDTATSRIIAAMGQMNLGLSVATGRARLAGADAKDHPLAIAVS
ncbi:hypothetical protein BV898_08227 [Hypsibius exemplaris]|uniref:Uncharacterized protein n=1 Tax=Hypsibius exemplaris TaxID=2072580 RepID=A0A1W0WRE5_HYPEX|nr:hypothetical protein BV898_08227 [Hypsibius exemplaris]